MMSRSESHQSRRGWQQAGSASAPSPCRTDVLVRCWDNIAAAADDDGDDDDDDNDVVVVDDDDDDGEWSFCRNELDMIYPNRRA